jgi:hypothetical protein
MVPSESPRADWRLRGRLVAVLAALVGTSLLLAGPRLPNRPPAAPAALAEPGPAAPQPSPPAPVARRPAGPCGLDAADVPVAPVGRCTVVEIGDSLGADLGWGLAREVPAGSGLDLVQLDRSSTGLANSAFYDWPVQLRAALQRYRPQLVLVLLGGNDQQGLAVNGGALQFPTPAWQRAYLERVRRLVDLSTAGGAYLLWVGLPVMQDESFSAGAALLNGLYRQAVRIQPRAAFLPTWSLFAGPGGGFRPVALVNGSAVALRQPDGIHFSFAGEDVFATCVIRALAGLYHVRLAPADPFTITGM